MPPDCARCGFRVEPGLACCPRCGESLLLGAADRGAPRDRPDPEALAVALVERAREIGVALDFTIGSLPALDAHLDFIWPAPEPPDALLGPPLQAVRGLGAYVGELLVRATGARWGLPPTADPERPRVQLGRAEIDPWDAARTRLLEGPTRPLGGWLSARLDEAGSAEREPRDLTPPPAASFVYPKSPTASVAPKAEAISPITAAEVLARRARLDFSIRSLADVDASVMELARAGGLGERELWSWGCYVGEVVRRAHDGEWERDLDRPLQSGITLPGGLGFCPFVWVARRVATGESLPARYRTLASLSAG